MCLVVEKDVYRDSRMKIVWTWWTATAATPTIASVATTATNATTDGALLLLLLLRIFSLLLWHLMLLQPSACKGHNGQSPKWTLFKSASLRIKVQSNYSHSQMQVKKVVSLIIPWQFVWHRRSSFQLYVACLSSKPTFRVSSRIRCDILYSHNLSTSSGSNTRPQD